MSIAELTLEVLERNSTTFEAQIFQDDNITPLPLAGHTVEFYVKVTEGGDDTLALQKLTSANSNEVEIFDSGLGKVRIKIPATSPAVTGPATHFWRLDVLLNGQATGRKTARRGPFEVKGI